MSNTTVSRKKIQNYSYIINNIIGKGYSSQVFKGRNDITNQQVAIKVIDLKMLKNQINVVLLQSQINILKEIKSLPHILNMHDVFTTKNNTYIITELCDNDFGKQIKKKLSQSQACSYLEQIIKGYLNFATKDIIHRDLKPANILISNSQLKIADFGFAIKVSDAHKYNKYNVGSPLYMAPQSLKKNQYSLQSDIWALGIIFYQMLTGSTPWKAKNQKDLLKKIENESIDDILQIMAISNMSKSFLRKTLRLDKKTRLNIQDLKDYKFTQSTFSNILMQKKLNGIKVLTNQKSLSIFGQNHSLKICKTPLHKEKTINLQQFTLKKSDNKIVNNENTIKIQVKAPVQSNSIKSINLNFVQGQQKKKNLQKQNATDVQYKSVHVCLNDNKKEENLVQKKMTTKILISQIHFCRFLYKLMMKILESNKKGLLQYSRAQVQRIMCSYVGIIKHKIQNVLNFNTNNFLKITHYQQYKSSSDYQKVTKIAKQYKNRYSKDLIIYWSTAKVNFSSQSTQDLISHLHKLLSLRKDNENTILKNQRQIIILDYLITAKSLLQYFKNGQNYQRFAKRSKIQDIVQGKTLQITLDLYERIMERVISKGYTQEKQKFYEQGLKA